LVQKRLRRERRARRQLQEQFEVEVKRRLQMEEALRAAGAGEQIRIINENFAADNEQKLNNQKNNNNSVPNQIQDRIERPQDNRDCSSPTNYPQNLHQSQQQQQREQQQQQVTSETKPWGYSGIDLINSGAAFWQNYSESLAQELELERKSRQQQVERDVKSPLQDRSAYYKNSVLFTSSAT
ncbi:PREDICTED: putative uncharacterized protein DDB_G0274435, partial [Nicrophorus vespilloides]|uniref:Dachshund n=1 Tax=Nicrophorus vespilloides TaxID=110193 RepID=A0ABM1M0K3_NICVS